MSTKWQTSTFKNPIANAKGLGSAKSGFDHWWLQRVTAVSNIFLLLWAICSVISLVSGSFESMMMWFTFPVHSILLSLFVISSFTHAALGLQVVIEDYVHCEASKIVSLIALRLVCTGLAVAALFSIIKLAH